MRLKSKSITLVALIVLTATPRVFDQLADLKNSVEARFRTELLNVFWGFTTPETKRDNAARQYSELLARAQEASTSRYNSSDEIRMARVQGRSSLWRRVPPASDLGHRQPADEPSPENLTASVAAVHGEKFLEMNDAASLDKRADIALIARNFRDYPAFDETSAPVVVEDAVAQYEWKQENETPALPDARPAAFPKKAFPNGQRFTQKFVRTNFQVQLPENLDGLLNNIITNSDALIKARDIPVPAKPKCRVRVLRLAPDAPRPPDKPAIVS
jgi:hypothetical protein